MLFFVTVSCGLFHIQILCAYRVTAVVVASPTVCHEDTVRGALQHGKHVFCEKPVAQDEVSSERCFKQAASSGKTLFCAFNR